MVLLGSKRDLFWCAVFAQHLTRYVVMLAFHFVRERLAHIVHKRRVLCDLHVGTQLLGEHTSHVRHFSTVFQDVLAVAGAIFELTKQM